MKMKRILRYWHGAALGVLATFVAAVPVSADIASDQKSVFGAMLPIFICVVTVASIIVFVRQRNIKAAFKGFVVGGISFVVSLFLVDVL